MGQRQEAPSRPHTPSSPGAGLRKEKGGNWMPVMRQTLSDLLELGVGIWSPEEGKHCHCPGLAESCHRRINTAATTPRSGVSRACLLRHLKWLQPSEPGAVSDQRKL